MKDDDWMAKHVIVGLVTDPEPRVPSQEYYRVHWRGASVGATPAFMDYGAADLALALEHRNRVRAGGGTAEVYRCNRATGLDERLP